MISPPVSTAGHPQPFPSPCLALSEHVPTTNLTFQWISALVNRYPETLQAVRSSREQTPKGWGAKPASKAYAKLFMDLRSKLRPDLPLPRRRVGPGYRNDPENRSTTSSSCKGCTTTLKKTTCGLSAARWPTPPGIP
jgi:hypothetical protein